MHCLTRKRNNAALFIFSDVKVIGLLFCHPTFSLYVIKIKPEPHSVAYNLSATESSGLYRFLNLWISCKYSHMGTMGCVGWLYAKKSITGNFMYVIQLLSEDLLQTQWNTLIMFFLIKIWNRLDLSYAWLWVLACMLDRLWFLVVGLGSYQTQKIDEFHLNT